MKERTKESIRASLTRFSPRLKTAIPLPGCSRLSSRITDLKRKGYPVASRMVTRRNRYGRLCRVAEYYMEV